MSDKVHEGLDEEERTKTESLEALMTPLFTNLAEYITLIPKEGDLRINSNGVRIYTESDLFAASIEILKVVAEYHDKPEVYHTLGVALYHAGKDNEDVDYAINRLELAIDAFEKAQNIFDPVSGEMNLSFLALSQNELAHVCWGDEDRQKELMYAAACNMLSSNEMNSYDSEDQELIDLARLQFDLADLLSKEDFRYLGMSNHSDVQYANDSILEWYQKADVSEIFDAAIQNIDDSLKMQDECDELKAEDLFLLGEIHRIYGNYLGGFKEKEHLDLAITAFQRAYTIRNDPKTLVRITDVQADYDSNL